MRPAYQIRIIANACITRYNNGEGDINTIVDRYTLEPEDREAVMTEIRLRLPDLPE